MGSFIGSVPVVVRIVSTGPHPPERFLGDNRIAREVDSQPFLADVGIETGGVTTPVDPMQIVGYLLKGARLLDEHPSYAYWNCLYLDPNDQQPVFFLYDSQGNQDGLLEEYFLVQPYDISF